MSEIALRAPKAQDRMGSHQEAIFRLAGFVLPPALFLVALVALWAAGANSGVIPHYLLPAPSVIAWEFVSNTGVLLRHGAATATEALGGFVIGSLAGLAAATAFSFSPTLRDAFYPYALLSRALPVVVFTPLVVVLLGRGMPPIIAIVAFTVYFPTFLGMMRGLNSADADYHEMLHTLSGSRLQRLWLIDFPAAMPYFFAALKVSASGAFISALIAEWVGSNVGLGYLVVVSSQYFKLPTMWAAIFTSALMTLALLGCVTVLERLLGRYTKTGDEGAQP